MKSRLCTWMINRSHRHDLRSLILVIGLFVIPSPVLWARDNVQLQKIKLPPGFVIGVFANVPAARSLARGDNGTIFFGTRGDKIFAVRDSNGDGKADRIDTLASYASPQN